MNKRHVDFRSPPEDGSADQLHEPNSYNARNRRWPRIVVAIGLVGSIVYTLGARQVAAFLGQLEPMPEGDKGGVGDKQDAGQSLQEDQTPTTLTDKQLERLYGITPRQSFQVDDPDAPAMVAVGTDACPGTPIASLPYSDSDTTIGANNTVTAIPGGCSTYTTVAGPDKIYTFTVVTAGSLTVLATPSGGTYDLATYLISTCPGGTGNAIGSGCIGGIDAHADNSAETFTIGSIALGTYYLYVDSFYTTAGKSSGPYTLSVTGTAVLGAGCMVTCPTNITSSNDPNQCGAVITYSPPTTSGSCSAVTCSPASGSFFPVGTTTVTCMESGPSCSFTVTINDTQPPSITCPGNVTQSNDSNQCGAVVTYAPPTASDNCPGVTTMCSPASGSFFSVGTTTVTCTAMDASPNTASCPFTVTINDTQPPSITCPGNITQSSDPNQCGAVVTYAPPTASDNCPGVTTMCSPASGSFFAVGTTTVTCTAMDASPNTASCPFTVTINDTQPPSITCPGNVTQSNDSNQCGAVVTYAPPTASDNCPGVTTMCSPASGSFFSVGTTTVTCTAMDASPNTASCPFTVTINDTQPPSITCPGNITQSSDSNQCGAVVTYAPPTASDNCPGVTAMCSPASGSSFPVGTTTVTCTAMDASPNSPNSTCTFTVTVTNAAPTANAGPDQTTTEGSLVTLSGSGTDANGQTLTYAWTQTGGPSVTINNANMAMATFTAPEVPNGACMALTFQLKVTDLCNAMAIDTVVINLGDTMTLQDDAGRNCVTITRTCTSSTSATYCWKTSTGRVYSGPCTLTFQAPGTFSAQSTAADPNAFQGSLDTGRCRGNARLTISKQTPTTTLLITSNVNACNDVCTCP